MGRPSSVSQEEGTKSIHHSTVPGSSIPLGQFLPNSKLHLRYKGGK